MNKDFKTAENAQLKKHVINFSVVTVMAITMFFIVSSFLQNNFYLSYTSNDAIIIIDEQLLSENIDFSYHIKDHTEDIETVFTSQIQKSDINAIGEKYLTIYTPNLQCEAFEILINDKSIAVGGDIKEYNSSLWTKNYSYTIEASLFDREINELKIIQYSRYMSGGLGNPLIIDGYSRSIKLKNYKSFDIKQGVFGISIILFLIIVLMMFLFKSKRKKYLIVIVSLSVMMIGYIEYFELTHLSLDFLLFKKIIVSSNLLAAGMGTLFFRHIFKKEKFNRLFISIYSLIVLIPTIAVNNMVSYKSLYTVLTFIMIPMILYWIYLSVVNLKKYAEAKLMLTLAGTSVVYILVWNISEVMQYSYMDSVTVVIMPSFMIVALTIIFIDMHELQVNIETTHKKSIIDNLTGLYNVEFMKNIILEMEPPVAFAVYDIDDFKTINDSFGHITGDEALIHMSKVITSLLREGDILGRYGGDEFILLLNQNSAESVNSILERIRKEVETTPFIYQGEHIKMTISLGYYISYEKEDFKSMLEKADYALYQAKHKGKNNTVLYTAVQKKLTSKSFKLIK